MRPTLVATALFLALSAPACAHDPQQPQTPCGKRTCPPTQQEKIEQELGRQQDQMIRRGMNEAQSAFWRWVRGR
jgi:hypothetical protein